MVDEYTVLSDWSQNNNDTHREIAEKLLPQLKEEMPDEEYHVDFLTDLQSTVLEQILRDLHTNAPSEDWLGMGYEEPEDFLDAESLSEDIGELTKRYFEDDQIGKSWEILTVIFEYAEEYDLVGRKE